MSPQQTATPRVDLAQRMAAQAQRIARAEAALEDYYRDPRMQCGSSPRLREVQ